MRTYEFGSELHFSSSFPTATKISDPPPSSSPSKNDERLQPASVVDKAVLEHMSNSRRDLHVPQVPGRLVGLHVKSTEPSTAHAQSFLSWPHDRPSSLEALPRPVSLTCCLAIPACPLAWSRHRLQSKTSSGEASWTTSGTKNKRFGRPCAGHRAGPCFLEHVGGSRDRAGYHSTR